MLRIWFRALTNRIYICGLGATASIHRLTGRIGVDARLISGISLLILVAVIILLVWVAQEQDNQFQPLAFPTRSDATVFNAVRAAQVDADNLNAVNADVTTLDAGTLRANVLNAQSYSGQTGAATARITNTLRLGEEAFSGAITFGVVNVTELWGTLVPRYAATFNHNLGSIPTSCIAAGAAGIDSKLASIYDLTTTSGRVVVSTQGQVFWICGK